ncbi:1-deoxy-D-xylulose-5-phosphate synthase [Dermabacteraceae bacterium P13264]
MFEDISTPQDVRSLPAKQLPELARELRARLLAAVAENGGHLGPNLGVVELTIALHRAVRSPEEPIVFDTGHQSYVHKMLTGRAELSQLRREGGVSGYPSRAESEHDVVENSHASGSIGWAHGIERAGRLLGTPRVAVAVIGDGALTGGVALEALNNLAADPASRTIVVLNDNARSYAPTIGGLAAHLAELRSGAAPDIFTQLGLGYVGPLDGHDVNTLERELCALATRMRAGEAGPTVVHVVTRKGNGFNRAEEDVLDQMHATGPFQLGEHDGEKVAAPQDVKNELSWSEVFGQAALEEARKDPRTVAISAAMVDPVGFTPLQEELPERVLDVGIAEQEALVHAAGLARGGMRPLVALYSTFMNRAFDQLLLDIALHKENVTVALDRAGITGEDGPSHHGVWDLALAARVPGLRVAAPRDAKRLREALAGFLADDEGPALLRYSKGSAPTEIPSLHADSAGEVVFSSGHDALLVAVGAMVPTAIAAAEELAREGIRVEVVDPLQALPVSEALVERALSARAVFTLEDGLAEGGVGTALLSAMAAACPAGQTLPRFHAFGVGGEFLPHASRARVLTLEGMDAPAVVRKVRELI